MPLAVSFWFVVALTMAQALAFDWTSETVESFRNKCVFDTGIAVAMNHVSTIPTLRNAALARAPYSGVVNHAAQAICHHFWPTCRGMARLLASSVKPVA
jgi:hypothetical protein